MADIDLRVPPQRHAEAVAVLARLGYRAPAASRHHHAVKLERGDDTINLHRGILAPRVCEIVVDDVWRRAHAARERTNGPCRLDAVDEVLFHFAALARTRQQDLRETLRAAAVDQVDIRADADYLPPLIKFFRMRGRRN